MKCKNEIETLFYNPKDDWMIVKDERRCSDCHIAHGLYYMKDFFYLVCKGMKIKEEVSC